VARVVQFRIYWGVHDRAYQDVHDRIFGDFPANYTVHTPYTVYV